MSRVSFKLLSLSAGVGLVSAHGFVQTININGESYQGYDVTSMPYQDDAPAVIGWSTDATDLGFVDGSGYSDPDIICHKGAQNAQKSAPVAPGDTIDFVWNTWPESHEGPIVNYLADCGGDCTTVDKSTLKFVKFDQGGLVDGSSPPGHWVTDDLIANNNTGSATIPTTLKAGSYVLRHEIIALHGAGSENGAQNYPQCINIEVTGDGTEMPEGTAGTALYDTQEPGILVNM